MYLKELFHPMGNHPPGSLREPVDPDQPALLHQQIALALQRTADPGAFATLYDSFFPRVYTYIRVRVTDDQTADDLTAQVFERALTKINRYQPELAPFGAWLFGIARHTVNNHLRAERRRGWLSLDFLGQKPAREPHPEEIVVRNETEGQLWQALSSLRDFEKELVLLKYVAGLSTRQIGEITGLSESNVSVILHRTRSKLKERLNGLLADGLIESQEVEENDD